MKAYLATRPLPSKTDSGGGGDDDSASFPSSSFGEEEEMLEEMEKKKTCCPKDEREKEGKSEEKRENKGKEEVCKAAQTFGIVCGKEQGTRVALQVEDKHGVYIHKKSLPQVERVDDQDNTQFLEFDFNEFQPLPENLFVGRAKREQSSSSNDERTLTGYVTQHKEQH
ncbi:hypothetical protein SLEP1_g39480 [Rubroshorea leprosula]|uniref:Uncharacterized protein n=1 Tax=Rubroshorea leprosula TaxID=152421 RepID=A0AAV5L0L4_9ROSI|nr:hypothetical protein SLEP1_g39480 [Rubroshorea leprosula]